MKADLVRKAYDVGSAAEQLEKLAIGIPRFIASIMESNRVNHRAIGLFQKRARKINNWSLHEQWLYSQKVKRWRQRGHGRGRPIRGNRSR